MTRDTDRQASLVDTLNRPISRAQALRNAAVLGLSAPTLAGALAGLGAPATASAAATTRVNLYHTIPAATETFWKTSLLSRFRKAHPNIDLETFQLGIEDPIVIRTKLKSGGAAAPSMAWLESGETGVYVGAGLLPDVGTWLDGKPAVKDDIYPSLINLSSYHGKVRSLPWMTNNTAMWINLDAFREAKVPVPSQDPEKTWTWDQFQDACKKLSALKGMKGFLMNVGGAGWDSWLFHAWLGTAGGTFLSQAGAPSFNSAAGAQTLSYLQNLVKSGYTTYTASGQGYDASPWYTGKAAIHANGPWNFPDLLAFKKFKFTVVPYPRHKQPATNTGGDQLFIFSKGQSSDQLAASYAYAEYMLSDAFQVAFNIESGNLPVTKSATASKAYQAHLNQYPFLKGWVNAVPYGVARSSLPTSTNAQSAFGKRAWDPIMIQKANVQSALADAANAVSQL